MRARHDGSFEPAWLAERDDVWIREVIDAVDARVGRPAGDLEADLRQSSSLSPGARADARALRGVLRVILRGCRRDVDAPAEPAELRRAAFRAAARARADHGGPFARIRSAVLEDVSRAFGVDAARLEAALYADRAECRIVRLRGDVPSPVEVREAYQLALLQGFLLRSSDVRIWIRSHVRSVARFAKLERLLCTFELDGDATRIHLSGPLALFHSTLKYGRALAGFVPSVVSTPGWRLEARCSLPTGPLSLAVDASAPLPRTHAVPRDTDSRLEAALARDLRRLGSGWTLAREAAALRVGDHVIFPDFVLSRGAARVLVEVVGFWTPEYLDSKLRALSRIEGVPLIVAVRADRQFRLPNAEVVAFDRAIDAPSILRAAERAAARAVSTGASAAP